MSHERDCADVLQFRPRPGNTDELADLRGQLRLLLSGNINLREAIRQAEWVPNPFSIQGWDDADLPTLLDLFGACDRASDKGLLLLLDRIADILGPIASGDQPFITRCFRCLKRPSACGCCPEHRRILGGCACQSTPDPADIEAWEDR